MNVIPGEIVAIEIHQNLSLVQIQAKTVPITAIVIDTPDNCHYLSVGTPINAIFKETEVILGPGSHHSISLQNQINGHIHTIETSQLLSKVVLNTDVGQITSIITTRAVQLLNLQPQAQVTAMIKTNEIMLSK